MTFFYFPFDLPTACSKEQSGPHNMLLLVKFLVVDEGCRLRLLSWTVFGTEIYIFF